MENKKVIFKNGQLSSYAQLLEACVVSQTSLMGANLKEMRDNIKLLDAFDTKSEEIILTKEQVSKVKTYVENMRWLTNDVVLVDFMEYVASL